MSVFEFCSALFIFSAVVGYVNLRLLKLPLSVALMIAGMALSTAIVLLAKAGFVFAIELSSAINNINFSKIVLDAMLCFLLFAGAMQTDFAELKANRYSIAIFSVVSTILNALLLALAVFAICTISGYNISFNHCMLLGAILSPTDPIAILGLLSKTNIPTNVKTTIVGESLFNDAIGVVLFVCILPLCISSSTISISNAVIVFVQQAVGGVLLGIVLGKLLNYILASVDDYEVEILLTIGICMSGYSIAHLLNTSGPLAMVFAGLLAGRQQSIGTNNDVTETHVIKFWHLVDVVLNALLFLLMGLKVISLEWQSVCIALALGLIPAALLARYFSLLLPYLSVKKYLNLTPTAIKLMTWGGLRGGLSIAMAMSLAADVPHKNTFLICTYLIVIFSIVVQALSMEKVSNFLMHKNK
jgi:monovalent cation:H+ antiporter, CPA1 family